MKILLFRQGVAHPHMDGDLATPNDRESDLATLDNRDARPQKGKKTLIGGYNYEEIFIQTFEKNKICI